MEILTGTWKTTTANGVDEYMKAVGQSDYDAGAFGEEIVFELKAEGDKLFVKNVTGRNPSHLTTITLGKVKEVLPGIGEIETDAVFEGNKLVSKATYKGKEIAKYLYVEGDILYNATVYEGASLEVISKKA